LFHVFSLAMGNGITKRNDMYELMEDEKVGFPPFAPFKAHGFPENMGKGWLALISARNCKRMRDDEDIE
jgi:hypothetical protein